MKQNNWENFLAAYNAGIREQAEKVSADMNRRCVENFNEAVAKADALADECEIRRLLYDVFGSRSYCVTVERG